MADVGEVVAVTATPAVTPCAVDEVTLDNGTLRAVGVAEVPPPTAPDQLEGPRRPPRGEVRRHLQGADEGRDVARQLGRLGSDWGPVVQQPGADGLRLGLGRAHESEE